MSARSCKDDGMIDYILPTAMVIGSLLLGFVAWRRGW